MIACLEEAVLKKEELLNCSDKQMLEEIDKSNTKIQMNELILLQKVDSLD